MSRYIFIESRDPFDSRDVQFVEKTAAALQQRGNDVMVFLVQNGVLACRSKADDPYLSQLTSSGVTVLADDFSLRERGIRPDEMVAGIKPASIEMLVESLVQPGTKALWH